MKVKCKWTTVSDDDENMFCVATYEPVRQQHHQRGHLGSQPDADLAMILLYIFDLKILSPSLIYQYMFVIMFIMNVENFVKAQKLVCAGIAPQ